jgi:hypothetical protein
MTRRTKPPIRHSRRDLAWGVRVGAKMGGVYGAFAAVMMVSTGAISKLTSWEIASILGGYLAAGVVGGIVVGALRPYTRRPLGVAVTGAAVGIPVFAVMDTVIFGLPTQWNGAQWATLFIAAVLVGPLAALALWYQLR